MLEPRKKQSKKATNIPKDFIKTVTELFNKQFKKERGASEFLVYGNLYMDEILFCVSLTNAKSLRACSFYSSMDLGKDMSEKPELVTEKLKIMVDVIASWFSQSFQEGKEKGLDAVLAAIAEMEATWQSVDWENNKVFVKLNRDNHTLENAANKFLKQAGVNVDEVEEELENLDDLDNAEDDLDDSSVGGKWKH